MIYIENEILIWLGDKEDAQAALDNCRYLTGGENGSH